MPKSKNPKKNQHFVNQEYLRNFATPESIAEHRSKPEKWHVRVYDKALQKTLPSRPIRDVAFGKFFYNARGEPETLEDQFMVLEGDAAVVHRKLLSTKDPITLSADEKTTFAKYVAAQYLRTNQQRLLAEWVSKEQVLPVVLDAVQGREFVAYLARKEIFQLRSRIDRLEHEAKLAHFLSREERDEALRNIRGQINEAISHIRRAEGDLDPLKLEETRRQMVPMMQQKDPNHRRDVHVFGMMMLAPSLIEDLLKRVWRIDENKTGENLCTSDHPVLTLPLMKPRHEDLHHALLTLGMPDIGDALNEPGKYPPFRFIIPLSPKLTLSLYPQDSNRNVNRELPVKEIEVLNELQAIQSAKQIYSCEASFSFIDSARTHYQKVRAYINVFHPMQLPDAF